MPHQGTSRRLINRLIIGGLVAANAFAAKALLAPDKVDAHWWYKVHMCVPDLEQGEACIHGAVGGCTHTNPC